MVTVRLPPCDPLRAGGAPGRREHRIEILAQEWRGEPLILRVSFQGYNDASDLDALLTALRDLLPQ